MTHAISARLSIVGESPLPETILHGTDRDIPVIRWEQDTWCDVELTLGNHPNPGDYLEGLGRKLLAFAHEVRQAERDRRTIEPTGYDAPVVTHVGGCNERCDGDSHYLIGVEQ